MTPKLDQVLRDLANQRLDHARECEKKAEEYEKAAREMRAAAAADRELVREISGLSRSPTPTLRPPQTAPETPPATQQPAPRRRSGVAPT